MKRNIFRTALLTGALALPLAMLGAPAAFADHDRGNRHHAAEVDHQRGNAHRGASRHGHDRHDARNDHRYNDHRHYGRSDHGHYSRGHVAYRFDYPYLYGYARSRHHGY